MDEKTVTFNEYLELVKKIFKDYGYSDKEVKEAFLREDFQDEVKTRYDADIEHYKNKDQYVPSYKVLTEGCVGSVAHCLNLMW
ncbi:hypothetical protein GWP43_04805 [Treponema vincentii]|jgi:hypothetical protein|uniref:Uncharacterized protein n=1 Tax=Treponema vincentii TaxID=69710 RepID=A0A6P1Y1S9_9SPIR|nr:hypothetical protein [Treponema vincentii]QHX42882.1 hypothetical protein GWP43_04805 [Treponema vincentii]DAI00099.1 MAG TPA: UBA-like domain protein [Caudoviricetes sp.]